MRRIVLASKSPRRFELLSMTGLTFEVMDAKVNEGTLAEKVLLGAASPALAAGAGQRLRVARGAAGLGLYDVSGNSSKQGMFQLNLKTGTLDTAKANYKWKNDVNPRVFDVKQNPTTGDLWLATSKGLWKRTADGKVSKISTSLDTNARVTGLWMGGDPLTIIAETSRMEKESMKGALWVLRDGAKDFVKVDFLDTAGKKQKKDVYDDGDYTVSSVAFIGNVAYVGVLGSGYSVGGYFKLDSTGIRAWDMDDDGKNQWLYGYATGAQEYRRPCHFDLRKRYFCFGGFRKDVECRLEPCKTWRKPWNHSYGAVGDNGGRPVAGVLQGEQGIEDYD